MTPERAPSEPGHGISWLNSTSASVKSLWLNSKCGSTRSVTPIVSMGSGSEPAGRVRSVAARTAACRCATVGLRASASATSDCKPESLATGAESCPCAGPAPAITHALAVGISCRSCIPLLANRFPPERRSPRRSRRRVRAHYAWERLGLGRRGERRARGGPGGARKTESDKGGVSLAHKKQDPPRDHHWRLAVAPSTLLSP